MKFQAKGGEAFDRARAGEPQPRAAGAGKIERRAGVARRRIVAAALAAALIVALSGCELGYYARGAYEGARLLWNRQPISNVLAQNALSADARSKLELVLKVREFARTNLDLKVDSAYETYTKVDERAVTWLVSAARVDSLTPHTWWFPIVGAVPYKGYFSRASAEREAQSLEARQLDTYVRPVVAFSSLGFFSDPVLSNLLALPRVVLASVIIHELFHRTFYMAGNATFDESAANYVGLRGAVAFFTATEGAASPRVAQAREVYESNLKFARFLLDETAPLEKLYASDLPLNEVLKRRQALFVKIKENYTALAPSLSGLDRFDLDREPINNAVLVSYMIYFRDLDQFARLERLYQGDLHATIKAIITLAQKHPEDPFFAVWQAAQQ
jgi:predicted aminopeptidase